MSRQQIFAQKELILDSELVTLFGHDDDSLTYNGKRILTDSDIVELGPVGSSPNANAATLVDEVLALQPASENFPGVLTTGTQTLGGEKTFVTGIHIENIGTFNGSTIITEATLPPVELTVGPIITLGTTDGATINDGELRLGAATIESPGVVTSATQDFGGDKHFQGFVSSDAGLSTLGKVTFYTDEGDTSETAQMYLDNEPIMIMASSSGVLSNTFLGRTAGTLTAGPGNTGVGYGVGATLAGNNNSIFGNGSGTNITDGNYNVIMGSGIPGPTTGSQNILIAAGYEAGENFTTENNNVLIQNYGVTGDNNTTRIGDEDFLNLQLGGCGFAANLGRNAAFGSGAAPNLLLTFDSDSNDNTFIGNNSGESCLALGANRNTACGAETLDSLTSGDDNIGLGYRAGRNYNGESGNICIGNQGVVADASVIRIGTGHTSAFMAGIRGVSVTGGLAVEIDASGQLGTVVSSQRYKTDIEDLSLKEAEKLYDLKPKSFRIKKQRGIGVIAEEAESVFPDLVVKNGKGEIEGYRYNDLHGYYIALHQQAKRERDQHRKEIAELKVLYEQLKQSQFLNSPVL